MALSILFLVQLMMLPHIEGVRQTVVEGLSSNVDIICNLDRQFHPLYWSIADRIFELYNVPEIFSSISVEAITLGSVSRRMDGWRLQCFALDPSSENGRIAGVTTTLDVLYRMCGNSMYNECGWVSVMLACARGDMISPHAVHFSGISSSFQVYSPIDPLQWVLC
jgi:hypothetical protein